MILYILSLGTWTTYMYPSGCNREVLGGVHWNFPPPPPSSFPDSFALFSHPNGIHFLYKTTHSCIQPILPFSVQHRLVEWQIFLSLPELLTRKPHFPGAPSETAAGWSAKDRDEMRSEGFPLCCHRLVDDAMITTVVAARRGKLNHLAPNLMTQHFSGWLRNRYRKASVVEQRMLSRRLYPQSRGRVLGGLGR